MIKKILDAKVPSLRQKSKTVGKIDKQVKTLVKDMQETLAAQLDPEGVGLAAPQVGKNIRLFVISHKGLERVVINPKVVSIAKQTASNVDKNKNKILEGCLSIPHIYGPLRRAKSVTISYQDEHGKHHEEEFTGFGAQIVLHELDHLDGVLFVDKVMKKGGTLFRHYPDDTWEEVEL